MSEVGQLRVWWIPQVPMKPFHVEVASVEQGIFLLDALAEYDKFQFENSVKTDYCSAGGLEVFADDAEEDGTPGWLGWCDEETGIEDLEEYAEYIRDMEGRNG